MQKPPLLLIVHRWIALALAPLLLLQAATGAVLLFRDQLTQLTLPVPPAASGRSAPLSAIVAAAANTFPDMRLTRLFLPVQGKSAALAQLEGSAGTVRYAAIDPADAGVVSSGSIWRFPMEAALQIHFRLMAGSAGLAVVALNGLALALLAASGLWQWWPGASRVVSAMTDPARAPARLRLRAWHRTVGALLAFVLLASSVTGLLLALPNLPLAAAPGPALPAPPAPGPGDIDAAHALAAATYPGAIARDVRFAPDGSLVFNFHAPRGGKWGVDVVTVSTAQRRVIQIVPYEENKALWLTALPIHTGDLIGPAGRWPMLAAAFALAFLAISGPLAWRRARRRGRTT